MRELKIRDRNTLAQVTQLVSRVLDARAWHGWYPSLSRFGVGGGAAAVSEEVPLQVGLEIGWSSCGSEQRSSFPKVSEQAVGLRPRLPASSSGTIPWSHRPLPGAWRCQFRALGVFAPKSSEKWSSSINKPGSHVPAHCVGGIKKCLKQQLDYAQGMYFYTCPDIVHVQICYS